MSINRKLGDLANVLDDGTEGQVLSFNASGKIAASTMISEGTLGTLTQSFDSNQTSSISLSSAANTVPFVSVFKEIPQLGVSSKGQWDVNSNGTNYDFYDEKPISYSSSTLTPSATGDGTFTNSNAIVTGYDISLISSGYVRQINSWDYTGAQQTKSVEFSSNGTKIYFCETNNDKIKVFSLTTAYDITTIAGAASSELSVSPVDPYAVRINSSGTKLWVAYDASIEQFTLSTAHDLSTASSDGTWTVGTYIRDIRFNNNGAKIYIADWSSDDIKQYSLTSAYDITGTKSLDGSITGLTNPTAILFNNDGSKLYYGKDADNDVFVKNLGTAYDITTNVSDGTTVAYDSSANANNWPPKAMAFNSDGTRLFILHIYNTSPFHRYLSEFTSGSTNAFNSSDVGKKVVGNSGSAVITGTSGTYKSVTAFADTSAISSWQLFGAQGKADGSGIELSGLSGGYDFPNLSYTGRSFNLTGAVATLTQAQGMAMKPDGTKMWVIDRGSDKIVEFSLSTPYEINTASSTGNNLDIVSYESTATGIYVNSEGTRLIIIGSNEDSWDEFHLSTGWDLTTATHDHVRTIATYTSGVTGPQDLVFNEDGSRMFIISPNTDKIFGYTLSTAFDISTISTAGELSIASIETSPGALNINADGTELYISGATFDNLQMLKLDTAYDLSSYNASASLTYSWSSDGSNIGTTPVEGITISKNGTKLYLTTNTEIIHEYDFGDAAAVPYSQYMPALTNSSTGQINSSTWVDINSMTADETKNDGDIFYAVSTDNRTSWGVAKGSDGVRKIAKNNSGTWQYNNNAGTGGPVSSVADAVYNSQFSIVTASNKLRDILFNSDGTKMYLLWFSPDVRQYSLSVAYDISTAVSDSVSLTTSSEETLQTGMKWNNDGTKLYIIGYSNDKVHEYVLTTAYDLSTASYNNVFFSVSSQMATPFGLTFKPDGTKMYATDNAGNIYQYTLSTAWDLSSAAYDNISFSVSHLAEGLIFNSLGTKLHYVNSNTLRRWNLSTAWDISTLTFESSLDFDSDIPSNGVASGLAFNNDESRIYITWRNADGIATYNLSVLGYGASETWVNGTNNNEHATLQQALTSQAFNRMNKAQLDAVADGYHFSQDSADTLDLMIAPYATSGTSPISDGVTINYDAASTYKQAIHGTEYDVEFTTTNSVDLTSKISANLKARVL